jgi:hypothetical protein
MSGAFGEYLKATILVVVRILFRQLMWVCSGGSLMEQNMEEILHIDLGIFGKAKVEVFVPSYNPPKDVQGEGRNGFGLELSSLVGVMEVPP